MDVRAGKIYCNSINLIWNKQNQTKTFFNMAQFCFLSADVLLFSIAI